MAKTKAPAQQRNTLGYGPASAVATPPAAAATTKHGSLTHGRQADIPREADGIMKYVNQWSNPAIVSTKTKNQMKFSQKNMIANEMVPILAMLKSSAKHLSTVEGQFRNLFDGSDLAVLWEAKGQQIKTLWSSVTGGEGTRALKKLENDSIIGKINKFIGVCRTYMEEETEARHRRNGNTPLPSVPPSPHRHAPSVSASAPPRSGAEVIHDRLVFAATSFKPLVMLRDAWMSKASGWHSQMRQAKDAYDKEVERAKAAVGRKRALRSSLSHALGRREPCVLIGVRRALNEEEAAPCKKMRVTKDADANAKHAGSITAKRGDTCEFVEQPTNPKWIKVKMLDGANQGKTGIIPVRASPPLAHTACDAPILTSTL